MRFAPALILVLLAPRSLAAQAAIATDLWRVVQGTQTRPLALAEGAGANLWTPAIRLDTAMGWRVGIEAVHAPTETGVQSGFLSLALRRGRALVHAGYGRVGINDVAVTETSPETLGNMQVWSQSASIGAAIEPVPFLTAGASMRYVAGRLGPERHTQAGLDVGVRYDGFEHLHLGASTQFFDPTFGPAARGAVYNLGAEYLLSPFDAWGAPARLAFRYGMTMQQGEAAQQLLTAGAVLGRLGIDWGVAHENAFGHAAWRSRFGLSLGAGSYRVEIGRDGGVNDFGATWRFGMTGEFR
jgi:hypothetical protein